MSYYPKHLKVRHHKRALRLVAMAALAGCVFEKRVYPRSEFRDDGQVVFWGIVWSDGQKSQNHISKVKCAVRYLKWYLGKHDAIAELERRTLATENFRGSHPMLLRPMEET